MSNYPGDRVDLDSVVRDHPHGDHVIDIDELVEALLVEAATSSDRSYAMAMADAAKMVLARIVP